jgi:NAD(P)H dehydrogenase (quinone)
MIAVTGATGQLGRLVIERLLDRLPAQQVVALARDPDKASALAARGVQVREADYDRPQTLERALAGVDKLLLVSSSEIGKRARQHAAVMDAAKRAGVQLIAYTSVLHADVSPLGLAEEHRQTEAALAASGIPHVLLRNGWYAENYMLGIPTALQYGVVMGSAGEGRISSASRADYADAAAAVLTAGAAQAGRVYELAGGSHFTLARFAAELARQSGKPVAYQDMPEAAYKAALLGAGLPEPVAQLLADSDAAAAKGALHGTEPDLEQLIGRPAATLQQAVAAALKS